MLGSRRSNRLILADWESAESTDVGDQKRNKTKKGSEEQERIRSEKYGGTMSPNRKKPVKGRTMLT